MTKSNPSWMTPTAVKWHQAHKMPKNPTTEQRITWHKEHTKHCTCRPMPDNIKTLINQ